MKARQAGKATLLLVVGLAGSCGKRSEDGTSDRELEAARRAFDRAESIKGARPAQRAQSQARSYARTVRADLDVTTLEQLMKQMPDTLQPQMSRSGVNRTLKWVFGDGSSISATFRPLGGEGSGKGLVLYMVDIRD
jgi:hypothetical protein